MTQSITHLLEQAIASRTHLFTSPHNSAFRLFNGFTEGYPDLTLDIYGQTLVTHNYADHPLQNEPIIRDAVSYLQTTLNWLYAVIIKHRNGRSQTEKRGQLIFGKEATTKIKEHGVWYALNLMINHDASFYLDTGCLRKWLIENMRGKSVLNTFAYTGSLGVAAAAGGASLTVQTDRNRQFLNLAKDSYSLNGFPFHNSDFITQDFFPAVAKFKSTRQFFDCVIIDPPFFSTTTKGRVDQVKESARLINKIRPLINDGGNLIAINNALYVSGQDYIWVLEDLCKDGYLEIKELIPVPKNFIGYNQLGKPITDPLPFNHSTKIAVLGVRRRKTG